MKNIAIISAVLGIVMFSSIAFAENTHELRIASISAPDSIDAGAQFYVTATIKNRGDVREDFVGVAITFDKKLYTSPSFSILPGETADRIFTLRAPDAPGKYRIDVELANAYNTQKQSVQLTVSSLFLSLALSKSTAAVGEWVGVFGYATRDGTRTAGSVNLYRDSYYVGTIATTENGYYSTQIKFDSSGYHSITAILGDVKKEQQIYIYPQAGAVQTPAPPGITVAPNYTAVIIVTPAGQSIIYPASIPSPRGRYEGFSFVNIEASAKEIDAMQYGRNRLAITVTNHLGRSGLFSINTDFDDRWVFLPESDVIYDGETRAFEIYFAPTSAGRFNGSVYVFENSNLIKTIPVSLFVAPPSAAGQAPSISARILKEAAQSAGTIAALIALAALLYVVLRKPGALEPLGITPMAIKEAVGAGDIEAREDKDGTDIQKKLELRLSQLKSLQPKAGANGFFQVPQRNIII